MPNKIRNIVIVLTVALAIFWLVKPKENNELDDLEQEFRSSSNKKNSNGKLTNQRLNLPAKLTDNFKKKLTTITTLEQANTEIKQLLKCYADLSCGPLGKEEIDPKYRYFRQSNEIRSILKKVESLVNDANSKKIHSLIQTLANQDDDWLKSKLVKFVAKLSPSQENFENLVILTKDSSDSGLYKQAFDVMQQKYAQDYNNEIDRFAKQAIKGNSFYVSKYMSKQVGKLLSRENISGYKKLLATLPKASTKYSNVYNALAGFKKQ